jgi:hypothetical protein
MDFHPSSNYYTDIMGKKQETKYAESGCEASLEKIHKANGESRYLWSFFEELASLRITGSLVVRFDSVIHQLNHLQHTAKPLRQFCFGPGKGTLPSEILLKLYLH